MSTSTYYLTFDTQECNICYETEQSFFIRTRCGHEMCTDCYELLKTNNCPFCRQTLENKPSQVNSLGLCNNPKMLTFKNNTGSMDPVSFLMG